jgi:LemA protein
MELWVILGVIVATALFAVMLYNRLVALRQGRRNAFSDIDVQLRQRYDLVPQLIETVKGYASHEKQLFENVTAARAQVGKAGSGPDGGRVAAENALGGALMGLLAVAENYPALKADGNFQKLMSELSDIENKIAAARRFFNSATNEYNTGVQQFPANLLAGAFGFKPEEEFYAADAATGEAMQKAPDVSFH